MSIIYMSSPLTPKWRASRLVETPCDLWGNKQELRWGSSSIRQHLLMLGSVIRQTSAMLMWGAADHDAVAQSAQIQRARDPSVLPKTRGKNFDSSETIVSFKRHQGQLAHQTFIHKLKLLLSPVFMEQENEEPLELFRSMSPLLKCHVRLSINLASTKDLRRCFRYRTIQPSIDQSSPLAHNKLKKLTKEATGSVEAEIKPRCSAEQHLQCIKANCSINIFVVDHMGTTAVSQIYFKWTLFAADGDKLKLGEIILIHSVIAGISCSNNEPEWKQTTEEARKINI